MEQIAFHYGITDNIYQDLLVAKGIKPIDFLTYLPLFDPDGTYTPLSKIHLLYYLDQFGNFDEPPLVPHKRIAKAIFDNLDIKDKFEIIAYIQHINL